MSDSDSDDDVPLMQLYGKSDAAGAPAAPAPAPAAPPAAAAKAPEPAPAPAKPPAAAPAAKAPAAAAPARKATAIKDDDSSDDDEPIAKRKAPEPAPPSPKKPKAEEKPKAESSSSSSAAVAAKAENGHANGGGEKKPAAAPAAPPKPKEAAAEKPPSGGATKKRPKPEESSSEDSDSSDDSSEDEAPLSQKKKAAEKASASSSKPKKAAPPPKKKKEESSEEEEEDDDDDEGGQGASQGDGKNWQDEVNVDGGKVDWARGGVKWTTLEWSGVLFPPLYEKHGVQFLYDGKPVKLNTDQEEVATMYAGMLQTAYINEEAFQQNFMASWRPLLKQTEEAKHVKELAKCDFSKIAAHLAEIAQAKKDMAPADKKAAKAKKDEEEEPYLTALVDGRKEKLGNFRVEPPGLFRGRGKHPKMGKLKARIQPEDITLNMSKKAKVPPVPDLGDGKVHKWGDIVHKNNVTWLAKWKDSINGEDKCVWLAANSSWKGKSDMAKYEKARELKKHIAKVRSDYTEGMLSKDREAQQRSVAVYLIDRLALRVGGEKDTDEEADTVGCCSLRVEHVKLDVPENHLHLNFLGKDSIEYDNTNEIDPRAYKLILRFMKDKAPSDQLFDKVVPPDLNDYFKSVMQGLSAKVFRTYNASITLCSELQKTSAEVTAEQRKREGDVTALCNYYTLANKQVAILCNHQKAASANHGEQIAKMDENIEKVRGELKEAKKAKSGKVDTLQKRLDKLIAARNTKEETKCVSLGTSKINYNDPRITIAWCKKHDVPIQKQFPKTLLAKFAWAMGVDYQYRF